MGHERLGVLPKTQKWREVVENIAKPSLSESDVDLLPIMIPTTIS